MKISKELREFLENKTNQELLNSYNFEELYRRLNMFFTIEPSDVGTFSALMYEIGVEPLKYLKEVPSSFLCNQDGITSVIIPTNITRIRTHAFYNCKKLKDVVIPNNIGSIGDSAFEGCSGLTTVTIPSSITSIGSSAFYKCYKLAEINFNGTKAQWENVAKGVYWSNDCPIKVIHCTDGNMRFNVKL